MVMVIAMMMMMMMMMMTQDESLPKSYRTLAESYAPPAKYVHKHTKSMYKTRIPIISNIEIILDIAHVG